MHKVAEAGDRMVWQSGGGNSIEHTGAHFVCFGKPYLWQIGSWSFGLWGHWYIGIWLVYGKVFGICY